MTSRRRSHRADPAGRSTPVWRRSVSACSASSSWWFLPSASMTTEERVSLYTTGRQPASPSSTEDHFATAKSAAADVLSRNKGLEMRIAAPARGRGQPAERVRVAAAALGHLLVAGFLGTVIGGGSLGIGLLFLLPGRVGPWFYLGFRKRSGAARRSAPALPDTLQLMAGSLSAGLSLAQSIDTIVREGVEPIASEFRRVLVEARLGVSLETALERRGRALREQGLRLGRDGHQHPAPGRWQPCRAAGDGRRHHARARVHAPPGRRTRGRGQALGVSCWAACRRVPALPDAHQRRLRRA